MNRWIAALPMYNVTPRHERLWRALLADTLAAFARAGGPDRVAIADEPLGELTGLWRRTDLLLSQTCGFPYRMLGLRDDVHLVATPVFDAEGCDGPNYRSAFVVSASAWQRGATALPACFGLRAACNGMDSHSGMNALRHAVAAHAIEGRFFSSVLWSGSHVESLKALAGGRADIAAIDCVTLALLRDGLPDLLHDLHVIGMSACAPGLPLIASHTLGEASLDRLRVALKQALESDPHRASMLRLRGFVSLPAENYDRIEQMAREASALGYPALR
ncbi:PhnD/SsuA/transferrin family substrate-binding protein [Trinickia sp. NRRL B-1857]|uniref:phosphate/phosphite/phosphonate ABC transporter substrate-binding protein n=1 Tax=Trinickia sp. NRRL B-1857 TaxID=3162879 RepID=UPI003D2A340C